MVVRWAEEKNRAPDRVGVNSEPLQKRQREGLREAVLERVWGPGRVGAEDGERRVGGGVKWVRRVEGRWFAATVLALERERAEE